MLLIPTRSDIFFRGRPGDPRLGEFAQPLNISTAKIASLDPYSLIVLGAPDDTGVVLNRGRAGAAGGPDAIRGAFYKIAWPQDRAFEKKLRWFDIGNIDVSADILKNHDNAHNAALAAAATGATIITLGGGHDFAAPHFLGWADGIYKLHAEKKIRKTILGLINIDPHLDVREFENGLPHSGTPFRQILESSMLLGKNFIEFGARDGRNARAHFDFCAQQKVKVRMFEDLRSKPNLLSAFSANLIALEKTTTNIAATIDMDCCSELEGVSAAPVLGFTAWELCQMAYQAGKSKKVGMLELAEVAPALDPTGRAARISAEILFWFLKGRLAR